METFTVEWNDMHVLCVGKKSFSELKTHHLHVHIFSICSPPCDTLLKAVSSTGSILSAGYSPRRFLLAGGLPCYNQGPRSSSNFFIAMDSNADVLLNLSGTLPSHKLYPFLPQRNETTQFRCCRTSDSWSLRGFFSIPLPIALSLWAFGCFIFLLLPPVARETKSHTD